MRHALKRCVVVMAAVWILVSFGCSTTEETVYDITGTWQFTYTYIPGSETDIFNFIFNGSLSSGTAMNTTAGHGGTYTVNGTAVVITLDYIHAICGPMTETLSGAFTSPTTMSGSWDIEFPGPCMVDGDITWTAVKL